MESEFFEKSGLLDAAGCSLQVKEEVETDPLTGTFIIGAIKGLRIRVGADRYSFFRQDPVTG